MESVFILQKFFGNKNIFRKLKLRLKNTIIDKTLTYESETWILTETDRKQTFLKGRCTEESWTQYMIRKKKAGEY